MQQWPFVPSFRDALEAYAYLRSQVRFTPLEHSPFLSHRSGREIYLKWENQQICGAFKARGALYRMSKLTSREKERGVVTASSGNHGQVVALAAKELQVKATIFVPELCPETKRQAIRRRGGEWVELRVTGAHFDLAEQAGHDFAEAEGKFYFSSFDDPWLIAANAGIGMEMLFQKPRLDMILSPAGGGALMNGVALGARSMVPEISVWGIQSVSSQPWIASWKSGKVQTVEYEPSLADGLMGSIPQTLLDLAKKRIAGVRAVREESIAQAIALLHREHHQVVEGAGAVGVAALLEEAVPLEGEKIGVVISGGNIDHEVLLDILKRHA
ncbi:MAG TPA: threonine/serine dehydratase [Synergistaceae bacterium]|nr:threonine/serine dehydratase [Synergistaceae bacterium]HPQ36365.1 threonine/serine dehydratase [Synergistaceae bacterium]